MNWSALSISNMFNADWSDVMASVGQAMLDPSSNLPVAILILLIASILVTIILVIILIFVMGVRDEDDELAEAEYAQSIEVAESPLDLEVGEADAAPATPVYARRHPLVDLVIVVGIALLVWVVLGVGTSRDDVCITCHQETPHTQAMLDVENGKYKYVHSSLECVDCHESDSIVGRFGFETLQRSAHFLYGVGATQHSDYGMVASSGCLNCHEKVLDGPTKNKARGVWMSHEEPHAAGAECVDCHSLQNGMVAGGIGGMTRCVNCHDGDTASTECSTCHYADISLAGSAYEPSRHPAPAAQILTPDCGGCHNLKTECDSCHGGIRLPHTSEFIKGGHAREAVLTYWNGNGNTCFKCHTDERNSCGTCHAGKFWAHGPSWKTEHAKANTNGESCVSCHSATQGTVPDRNMCVTLCHTDRTEWIVH